jgi:hypothetical protein
MGVLAIIYRHIWDRHGKIYGGTYGYICLYLYVYYVWLHMAISICILLYNIGGLMHPTVHIHITACTWYAVGGLPLYIRISGTGNGNIYGGTYGYIFV